MGERATDFYNRCCNKLSFNMDSRIDEYSKNMEKWKASYDKYLENVKKYENVKKSRSNDDENKFFEMNGCMNLMDKYVFDIMGYIEERLGKDVKDIYMFKNFVGSRLYSQIEKFEKCIDEEIKMENKNKIKVNLPILKKIKDACGKIKNNEDAVNRCNDLISAMKSTLNFCKINRFSFLSEKKTKDWLKNQIGYLSNVNAFKVPPHDKTYYTLSNVVKNQYMKLREEFVKMEKEREKAKK